MAALAAVPALTLLQPAQPAQAASGVVSFVATASSSGNRVNHTVRTPSSVQSGDILLLTLTTNSTATTISDSVPGWDLVASRDGNGIRSRVWSHTATASDANGLISVSTSAAAKSAMTVSAYRSSGTPATVTALATGSDTSSSSQSTPQIPVAEPGSWLVSGWSEKSSSDTSWSVPNGVTQRGTETGTGSGKISAVWGDSDGPVTAGTAEARTATTSPAVSRSATYSVVISPGTTAPDPGGTAGAISYVAAASTAGNRLGHSVTVPQTVEPGDRLVLLLVTNSTTSTIDDALPGWDLLQSRDAGGMRGRAWTRQATAADAGRTVTVSGSAYAKSVMTVAAYRSTGPAIIGASAVNGDNAAGTNHVAPSTNAPHANSWLLNYWSEKSSDATTWSLPSGSTGRDQATGTGTGKVSSVLADSGGAIPVGPVVGGTATTSTSVSRTTMFSIVLDPGVDATETNEPPVAEFSTGCAGLTCEFDASLSYDTDKDPLTYNWQFGDGQTATGVNPSHTYAAAGNRTVTLTVDDGHGNTDQSTAQATPSAPNPPPGHTGLVPDTPRTNQPTITSGEIWDIEVVGNRVYVAGTFSSIRQPNNGAVINQSYLAAYNWSTGQVDTSFRPTFTNGDVTAVEASPDGTKLYISGNFGTVNGQTHKAIARINPATGAPIESFTANANGKVSELAVTNSTVYAGGRFTSINNVPRGALAALDGTTGAVRSDFVNNITGGIGTNGELAVQRLVLTHDEGRLLVVHTGRQVAGKDRYGVAIINTRTNKLTDWRTTLWEDNLQYVGGIQRAYGGDISPDDSYFIVSSGSGGDRPPINDTVIRFNLNNDPDAKPVWITRQFDSTYSVAITEAGIYVGGHFQWSESATAPVPWPGLDDVGYGTGQGLSGYSLGDAVVKRFHLAALDPADGHALEWFPTSNSYEGDKHIEATPRGIFVGGDGNTKGGYNVGRVAFFDFANVPAQNGTQTTITAPIEGRIEPVDEPYEITGTATAGSGIQRVEVEVMDRNSGRYLSDDLTTWGSTASNTINAELVAGTGNTRNWRLPLTMTSSRELLVRARAVAGNGTADNTKASKRYETFGTADQPPNTNVTGPGSPVAALTFSITGTATDDVGVNSVSFTLRDSQNRYLQNDGTVSSTYHTFRVDPDVIGATSTTWSAEVTVPYEDEWWAQARASDTAGQSDLDTADRRWIVTANGQPPTVSITQPTTMVPPTAAQPVNVTPGSPLTFAGSANDDEQLAGVWITLRNSSTGERLAADGSWGTGVVAGSYRVSPVNLNQRTFNWSYTTPFNLSPGTYTFTVSAEDQIGLGTSSANQGRLTVNAAVPGDAPPNGLLDVTGTVTGRQSLDLNLTGTATDDKGVARVDVALQDRDTSRYLQPNGTVASAFATVSATLANPGATTTTWSLQKTLPVQGDWAVTAYAVDTAGQQDFSTTGATARYPIYPGDQPPVMNEALLSPTEGTSFTDGRVFVSGRAEDDQAMQEVDVAIINSAGQYLSSSGTFTSTTPSWRTAFLNSPGTPGSNFSYTTPVIPDGAYTVQIRAIDQHGLISTIYERHATVSHPANDPPVADFTVSCTQNVCSFDARGSTDENKATLVYTWNFGNGTGSGPVPTRTYTSSGVFTIVLTARDEWGATATATRTVTIDVPPANRPPTAVLNAPACSNLSCNFSAVGSQDPDVGDTITYRWNWGDGTADTTTSAAAHNFPAAGTYTVKLTVTDGWGAATTSTRDVTVP